MLAAMTIDEVVGMQLIEGGVDASLFDNFIHHTLVNMKKDPKYHGRVIVVLMDNAVIHKHPMVQQTIQALNVSVLFNCEYSPWLNPIEQIFRFIKSHVRDVNICNK
jgi:hypothetical protein